MVSKLPEYENTTTVLPQKYGELKKSLADSLEEAALTKAWGELLDTLKIATAEIAEKGSEIIPQVNFADIQGIDDNTRELIKRRGAVVIKNVVPKEEANEWKAWLEEYVKFNEVTGLPADKKQFFELYWTRSQVKARSHPNVIKVQTWLNHFYHSNSENVEGLNLDEPLAYADRFRIRRPGTKWTHFVPHIDGGGIERWEDPEFRRCFENILKGEWKKHDAYDLGPRLNARNSLYGRPNAASVFRSFQGWLSLDSIGKDNGTLCVFPDVLLSNATIILSPFFRIKDKSGDVFDKENWEFDSSSTFFPGLTYNEELNRILGPRLYEETHPHLKLGDTMVSMPQVEPGDMVFWHCDVIHSVEYDHNGQNDASVIYIPAAPTTTINKAYIKRQAESFRKGVPPPDYPQGSLPETGNKGVGLESDIVGDFARKAMGLVD